MGICFVPRFCRYGKFALILSFLAVITTGIGARNTTTKELSSDSQPSYLAGQSSSHNPSFAEGYGNLPLRFEPNNGQSPRSVMFLCRGATSSLFFTKTEAILMMPVLDRHKEELKQPPAFPFRSRAAFSRPERVAVLRLSFLDTSPKAEVSGIGKLRSVSNYFIGNDPTGWRAGIQNFARVHYAGLYKGVDVTFYGQHRSLEFDMVVAPRASANVIQMRLEVAEHLAIATNGDLLIGTAAGEIRLERPIVFQRADGSRKPVRGEYCLRGPNEIGVRLGPYDHSRPVVIDPVLSYSTFLGGVGGSTAFAVFADAQGNAYVAGSAQDGFPTTSGVIQPNFGGNGSQFNVNAFVSKLNADGTGLIYSTYLGGTIPSGAAFAGDTAFGVTADTDGNAYLTGTTSSPNFPVVNAFQSTLKGSNNAFVAKVNPTGTGIVYSTFLGGSGTDIAEGIGLDSSGNAYITGDTSSTDFPTLNAFQSVMHSQGTTFVTKIAPSGSSLVYSTYLGGSSGETAAALAIGSLGNAYVTGTTTSVDFPTTNGAFQPASKAPQVQNVFFSKLSLSGNALAYSTLFGGSALTAASPMGIALDAQEAVYLTGWADASNNAPSDFPTTTGVLQPTLPAGDGGIFVLKIYPRGQGTSDLAYSTFLGSNSTKGVGELTTGIVVDPSGNVVVTGRTPAPNFPVTPGAFQTTLKSTAGGFNAFVSRLNPTASTLLYSTYLGGSIEDQARAISMDPQGNVYVAGQALSTDFPTTPNAFQTTHLAPSGGGDAFVAKFAIGAVVAVTPTSIDFGNQLLQQPTVVQTITVTNNSSAILTFSAPPALSGADVAEFALSPACGNTLAPNTSCNVTVDFTPTTVGPASAMLSFFDGDPTSPQTVQLSGTGIVDFALSAPATESVVDGGSVSFPVTVMPLAGSTQTVSLSCTGEPANSTCSVSPSSVTLDGTHAATANVTVQTQAAILPGTLDGPIPGTVNRQSPFLFAVLVLSVAVLRVRGRILRVFYGTALLVVLFLGGCGGGGSRAVTPKGAATLIITGNAGAQSHSQSVALTVN